MENYKNARDLLKKQLFDKLMCERFAWEINVGTNNFIVDAALTTDEHAEKVTLVEEIIRHLIYELDTYMFHIEADRDYQNIPTIFCLMGMSIEFDDTPINPDEVYEVDESTLNRTVDKEWLDEHKTVDINKQIDNWTQDEPDYIEFQRLIRLGEITFGKVKHECNEYCQEEKDHNKNGMDTWFSFIEGTDHGALLGRCLNKGYCKKYSEEWDNV